MVARLNEERQILVGAGKEEVHQTLSLILNSKYFIHAPKKQKFLRLICEFYLNGRAGELNEYLIGREVFDRNEEYNPAADPIVRVAAHDIRKKLELYYQQEGAVNEIRLEIPIGSYEPIFTSIRKPPPQQDQSNAADPSPLPNALNAGNWVASKEQREGHDRDVSQIALRGSEKPTLDLNNWVRVLYGVIALLAVTAALLGLNNINLRKQTVSASLASAASSLGAVWGPFVESNETTLLVLSNPPVYRLMNAGDTEIAIKSSVELPADKATALAQSLKDNFALRHSPTNPRLVFSPDTYTGMGEAIGAQRVTDLLRSVGKNVVIKRSRTMSAEDLKDQNVVLFGSVWSNEWSGKLPAVEDFHVTGQATIENHNPRDGDQAEYRSKFDEANGKLIEDYALVTVKPNISGSNVVMVLAGLRSAGTEAAAEFVTNKSHLDDMNKRLGATSGKNKPLRYYQALLKVGVENGIPTTISLVSLRELRNTDR